MAETKKSPELLFKNLSWSQDINRDTEWDKLKIKQRRCKRSLSVNFVSEFDVTDEDIKELKACFDLGFGFDPESDLDPKLKRAFPALEFYAAVNRQLNNHRDLSRSSSITSSDSSSSSSNSSSRLIVDPSDDPKKVKMKLKHWAQVVGCSIHVACTKPKISKVAANQ